VDSSKILFQQRAVSVLALSMRYVLLLPVFVLLACSPVQGEDTGPQIVHVTGTEVSDCHYRVGDHKERSLGSFDVDDWDDRDLVIIADTNAHYRCVTMLQDLANDQGLTIKIDGESWQNMTSVKAGAFVPTDEIDHPEARPYEKSRDASADISSALANAAMSGNNLIIVMGANWCHDSRGLAGWFATPRFAKMLSKNYEVVYVDVGFKDRNIDIAQDFGIKKIKGTPTVLVVSPEAKLLNPNSAPTWRNAASREEDAIFDYFDNFNPEI